MNKVHCADAAEFIGKLPDNSIDFVMTSPPYWGLRDYGVEQISGGDTDCRHRWSSSAIRKSAAAIKQGPNSSVVQIHAEPKEWEDGNCSRCGATRGQLGLERHPQEYIERLVSIFHDLRRVLAPHGSFFLNLATPTAAQRVPA